MAARDQRENIEEVQRTYDAGMSHNKEIIVLGQLKPSENYELTTLVRPEKVNFKPFTRTNNNCINKIPL